MHPRTARELEGTFGFMCACTCVGMHVAGVFAKLLVCHSELVVLVAGESLRVSSTAALDSTTAVPMSDLSNLEIVD